jgi:hypothetical protein
MNKHSRHVKSILNRSFRYTPSHETDLRKTFAKIRREQRLQARKEQADAPRANVSPIGSSLRAIIISR